ncbi:VrrA/YqfQ family protein [Sporolactobacillus nakayamae]|uniref:YqfQ-like protein n=1 Tax=Sporolactobacillus nakayamae TaxID=269670 RepID=A0A1I2P645_9BACL|nr:VrrA/YqfQ family protein [Sporolactobacillus nakayamae]SFG09086.1 YqfQ-like protein [Sporolactobacillus nakayamae]
MPPFEHGPEQPFFRNPPQSYTPPMTPTRGFPSIFPERTPQVPPISDPQAQSRGGIGGLISSFLSPGSTGAAGNLDFVGMIMNAQKAIQTAQSVLPMIQQFGPLVKNAPAILGALKGLQGNSSTEKSEQTEPEEKGDIPTKTKKKDDMPKKAKKKKAESVKATSHSATASKTVKGTTKQHKAHVAASLMNSEDLPTHPSVPRMYI